MSGIDAATREALRREWSRPEQYAEHEVIHRLLDALDVPTEAVAIGHGDDLDVAAGRCCPTCRNDLTPHNVAVWNAGYSVARRHFQDELREAWDAGFTAHFAEHDRQRRDPSYPISRPNPYAQDGPK